MTAARQSYSHTVLSTRSAHGPHIVRPRSLSDPRDVVSKEGDIVRTTT
jgi:hypothetical protein